MTTSLYVVQEPENQPTTREALEELIADDNRLWGQFEDACRAGVPELRELVPEFRETLKKRTHLFETHDSQFEEVFDALLAVAEELLPETPGAARSHFRERVRESVGPRHDGGVQITGDVKARRAVEVVLAHEDAFFDEAVLAAASGHECLYAVAHRFRDGLATIGREYPVDDVKDALLALVREIAPDSLAARPDVERLENQWRRAQEYASNHDPGGLLSEEVRQEHEVRALNALRECDLPGYRDALRGLCRAARDAAEGNRGKDEG